MNRCPKCGSTTIHFNKENIIYGQCQDCRHFAEAIHFKVPEKKDSPADEAYTAFINRPANDDDPFWQLFECKDIMNTFVMRAVEYGYIKGYTQATNDIQIVEQTKWDYVKTFVSKMNGWANFRAFLERECK